MKLITDQAGAGDGDVVPSSHRAVHTRWGDFNKGPLNSKLIYYSKLGLAADTKHNNKLAALIISVKEGAVGKTSASAIHFLERVGLIVYLCHASIRALVFNYTVLREVINV